MVCRQASSECLAYCGKPCYVSTENFRWNASYLVSQLHVGQDLSELIQLFPVYHIELPAEYGRVHPVFHVSYLHPHKGPVPPQPPAPLPLDYIAAGEYKVEDILDSRLGQTGPEYLIKWAGYPTFALIWEPVKHLANAPDIPN